MFGDWSDYVDDEASARGTDEPQRVTFLTYDTLPVEVRAMLDHPARPRATTPAAALRLHDYIWRRSEAARRQVDGPNVRRPDIQTANAAWQARQWRQRGFSLDGGWPLDGPVRTEADGTRWYYSGFSNAVSDWLHRYLRDEYEAIARKRELARQRIEVDVVTTRRAAIPVDGSRQTYVDAGPRRSLQVNGRTTPR